MHRIHRRAITAMAVLLTLASGTALAHTDEFLDTQAAPHGGQLRMAGTYHFELVVTRDSPQPRQNPVVVYVTDHAGAKVPTAGAKGTVTVLAGKARTTIPLAPAGDNLLQGAGTYASAADMKAVVSVTIAGKAAEQARFTPLAKAAAAAKPQPPGHSGH